MKNFIKLITVLLLLTCVNFTNVKASEVDNEFTTLTIKADVSDYNGEIAFVFEQDNGFKYNVLLTKDENYTNTIDIVGNMEYKAEATIKNNNGKYKIEGLSEKYNVKGKNVEIKFKVKKIDLQVTENTQVDSTTKVKEDNKLLDKETVYNNYIKAVEFIETDDNYSNFLKLYNNDIMKSYFLEADTLNTEDDWKQMSDFEKWNYYILFVRTKTLIMGENAVESESELLNNLGSESALLSNIENGNKVIEAVKTVWCWEWENWEKTGEFINIYDEYSEKPIEKHNAKELNDKKDNSNKNKNKNNESGLFNGLKNNIFSLLILLIVGIATICVVIIRKRKNYDNEES